MIARPEWNDPDRWPVRPGDMPRPGTATHTLLVYAVSEPGEWTAVEVARDLDAPTRTYTGALERLKFLRLVETVRGQGRSQHLYPTERGRAWLVEADRRRVR